MPLSRYVVWDGNLAEKGLSPAVRIKARRAGMGVTADDDPIKDVLDLRGICYREEEVEKYLGQRGWYREDFAAILVGAGRRSGGL